MSDWEQVLQFYDDRASFVLGFEAGRVWTNLRSTDDDDSLCIMVRFANAEIFMRMAEATHRKLKITEHPGDWVEAEFSARE